MAKSMNGHDGRFPVILIKQLNVVFQVHIGRIPIQAGFADPDRIGTANAWCLPEIASLFLRGHHVIDRAESGVAVVDR